MKKKRMIVISNLWSGMIPILFEGKVKSSGMPAFFNFFSSMCRNPEFHTTFYFISDRVIKHDKKINSFYSNCDIYIINPKYRILIIPKLIYVFVSILFSNSKLVYGHGSYGSLAGLISLISRKSNIRRIYGTFFTSEDFSSLLRKIRTLFKYPLGFLMYYLKHDLIIITNDGTHGDEVYKTIHKNTDKLLFLVNGVDKQKKVTKEFISNRYINYIARIDSWKQQHLAIEAFKESKYLQENYILRLIGPVYDSEYYDKIVDKIKDEKYIEYIGPVSHEEILKYHSDSILSLSFYTISNLGNSLIESLALGIPVVSNNVNSSLDYVNGLTINLKNYDIGEIKNKLEFVLTNKNKLLSQHEYIVENFDSRFKNWDERINIEIANLRKIYERNH